MKLALFDCDGTLINSLGIIHASMVLCFENAGFPAPSEADTQKIIGLTLEDAIASILDRPIDDDIVKMSDDYKAQYRVLLESGEYDSPLYPNIKEVLAKLHEREALLMGVVTGKSRRGLDEVIAKHEFSPYFVTSRTAYECPSKPNPAMVLECCEEVGLDAKDAVVIGDTSYDMQMAKSAGSKAIGVTWGYHSVEQLKDAGADHIISSALELLKLLEIETKNA